MAKSTAIDHYREPPRDGITGLQRLADPIKAQVTAALPSFMAKHTDRMLRCLFTECSRSPKLLECSPRSLFGAVIQVAQLGLELGGQTGQAYIVPFGGEASVIIGYKGFIALAHRSGMMKHITPRKVYAGDEFSVSYGTRQEIIHKPNWEKRGDVIGYYCTIEMLNGGTDFEYRTREEIEAHGKRYASRNQDMWKKNFDEMGLKTCVRYLAKRLPLSVEWVQAAGLDEAAEHEIPQDLGALVRLEGEGGEQEPEDKAVDLRARIDRARPGATATATSSDLPGTVDESGVPH